MANDTDVVSESAIVDLDPSNEKMKKKLFLSWDEAVARVEQVCGPIDRQHIMNRANKPGTFKAGKRANAPFPKLYPVDRESFEQWLFGSRR